MLESSSGSVDQQVGVLIVGAGPVGLCHALWLRQHDVDVLVIDAGLRSHRNEWVALGPDAFDILNRAGVRREFMPTLVDYDAVVILPQQRRQHGSAAKPRLRRLPPAGRLQVPLSLVNRAALEEALELRARELGARIERGQRLQRVEIRPTHCEARIVSPAEHDVAPRVSPAVTPSDPARRVLAQWVIGTDGQHSVVRRDLRAAFRPIAEARAASVVRLTGRRSVDVEGAVQVSASENAVHTVWPLGNGQLLWVTQTTGPEIPDGMDVDQHTHRLITASDLSLDAIHTGRVLDRFIERETSSLGIQVETVLSQHAIRYRPSVADPLGRGRAWTSGPASQVITPVLGLDDTLGLLEVPDLSLLLGFGVEDGLSGLPVLTPRLYHERRARLQQHSVSAHPLESEWASLRGWSSHDRDRVGRALPFLNRIAPNLKSPAASSRGLEHARG